jgi:hypothetical protein
VSVLQRLVSTMVDFDPRFEIMPGTKMRAPEVAHADPYEAVPRRLLRNSGSSRGAEKLALNSPS